MVAAGIKGKPSRAGNPTYPRMLLPERYSDEGVLRARSVGSARGHQDLVSRKAFGRRCSTLGAPLLPHVILRTVLRFGCHGHNRGGGSSSWRATAIS